MKIHNHLLILECLLVVSCRADLDVEDLIARGYTCSLAESRVQNEIPKPGVEVVCDDGVCSQCVKTGDGVKPWMIRNRDLDPEDYLRHGFVCSQEFRHSPDAEDVCDDGLCVGCKVM